MKKKKKTKKRKIALTPRNRAAFDLVLAVSLTLTTLVLTLEAMAAADVSAHRRMLENEAQRLYDAFDRYYERHGAFPNVYEEPRLELTTLEPLRRRGYYRGVLTTQLVNERIDGYDSPDDRGLNQEFWVELTFKGNPSIRYLVAKSDDSPSGAGEWLDGVFSIRGRKLRPI